MRYKEYSKSQLEDLANDLNISFDIDRLKKAKPIDVYDVVEFVGADIDWKYLSVDGSVLGATVFCDGLFPVFEKQDGEFVPKIIFVNKGTIIVDIRVDEGDNIGRKNFTVMHEVFHFLHHKKSFTKRNGGLKKILETEVFRSYEEKKKGMTAIEILEWQANYMAAAFLVPKSALINEIKTVSDISIDIDNTNIISLKDIEIKELTKRFSVSHQTMIYRLQSLGILRK